MSLSIGGRYENCSILSTHLDDMEGRRSQGPGDVLGSEDLDEINAALPALESSLVNASLDVVGSKTWLQLITFCVFLGHQLDPDIPKLSPRDLHRPLAVQVHVQKAVCYLGWQLCQHLSQGMVNRRELRFSLDRECARA